MSARLKGRCASSSGPASPGCTRSPTRRAPARSPRTSATASIRTRRSAARASCAASRRCCRAVTAQGSSEPRSRCWWTRRPTRSRPATRPTTCAPTCPPARRGGRSWTRASTSSTPMESGPILSRDMAALDTVKTDMTAAMKAGDRQRTQALRLVLSELQKADKEGRDDEVAVLRRERKRRDDAAQAYRDAGRTELAEQEEYESGIIASYLPAELSDAELEAI